MLSYSDSGEMTGLELGQVPTRCRIFKLLAKIQLLIWTGQLFLRPLKLLAKLQFFNLKINLYSENQFLIWKSISILKIISNLKIYFYFQNQFLFSKSLLIWRCQPLKQMIVELGKTALSGEPQLCRKRLVLNIWARFSLLYLFCPAGKGEATILYSSLSLFLLLFNGRLVIICVM